MEARIDSTPRASGVSRRRCSPPPATASGAGAFGDTLRRAKRTARRMRARRAASAARSAESDGPPPEVQRELAEAALACQALEAAGKELRFELRADGRVSVALIDVAGCAPHVIAPAGLFQLIQQSV
jgi:hypothetical protein